MLVLRCNRFFDSLIDRKIAWQQDNKKPEEPECPAGHRLVGNSEKQETLQLLKTGKPKGKLDCLRLNVNLLVFLQPKPKFCQR